MEIMQNLNNQLNIQPQSNAFQPQDNIGKLPKRFREWFLTTYFSLTERVVISRVCKAWNQFCEEIDLVKLLNAGKFNGFVMNGPITLQVKDRKQFDKLNLVLKERWIESYLQTKEVKSVNEKCNNQVDIFVEENLLLTNFGSRVHSDNSKVKEVLKICQKLGLIYNPASGLEVVLEQVNLENIHASTLIEAARLRFLGVHRILECLLKNKDLYQKFCLGLVKIRSLSQFFITRGSKKMLLEDHKFGKEFCLRQAQNWGEFLQRVPKELLLNDREFAKKLYLSEVQRTGGSLAFVPKDFLLEDLEFAENICLIAIETSGLRFKEALRSIQENQKSEEICLKAHEEYIGVFKLIPEELLVQNPAFVEKIYLILKEQVAELIDKPNLSEPITLLMESLSK